MASTTPPVARSVDAGDEQVPADGGPGVPDSGLTMNVGSAPIAVARADLMQGNAPLTVRLNGAESTDPDNDIAAYRWEFGDGTTQSTASIVSHTYVTPGAYTATLTVFDMAGHQSSATIQVSVAAPPPPPPMKSPPVAVATADVTSGMAPLTVNLSAAGSTDPDNDIAATIWTFGDGTSSVIAVATTHTFTRPGTYHPQVIVTDQTGQSDIAQVTIEVTRDPSMNSPPIARASANRTTGSAPLLVTLDASASTDADSDIVGYAWNFGDGTPNASGVSVQHSFTQPGTYTVTLTVQDSATQSSTDQLVVTVTEAQTTCPTFNNGTVAATVNAQFVPEASGIVASRGNAGIVWTHNDSGDAARVYAMTTAGIVVGAYNLVGAQAVDWEDIAIGPGPVSGRDYVFVGDIGDNSQGSNIAPVYRFAEPTVSTSQNPAIFDVQNVEVLGLRYPNNQAHNAETLIVDPQTGDIFIVTKHPQGTSQVFTAPAPHQANTNITLQHVRTLQFPGSRGAEEATGGDASPSGDQVIVRTYGAAYVWLRAPGTTMSAMWSNPVCPVPLRPEPQGEAITFTADARGYYTFSEGTGQPLWLFTRTN